ncbi:MAG: outer membrane lipoprotein carrier protein LolA [Acidobacteria bacterium]|nr:outer membrane lipoprotein carrier protein LolA [Acidobacteriota bacterium]
MMIQLLLLGFAWADQRIDPGLEALVARIDEVNSQITTLKADFTQRKEISLLTEPMEKTGAFFLDKPNAMKFEFDPESELVLLINQEEMVSISHKDKRAERIEMPKRKSDLTKMLITEQLHNLLKVFSIGRVDQTKTTGDQQLVLYPERRKLKKKIDEIRIWVNEDYLIYRIKVTSPDGDTFELHLANIVVNPELDANLFDTAIPEDYEIGDRLEFILGPNSGF